MSAENSDPDVFAQDDINSVGRMKERGHYDKETIMSIVRASPFLHVSFVDHDGFPQCIPMVGAIQQDQDTGDVHVFLHGHAKARLVQLLPPSTRVCLTASILDGLVLALSAFHHSMNYRSAVLHGEVVPFDEEEGSQKEDDEKWEAAKQIVNKVVEGRWDACRQPTKAEMKSTGFIKIKVLSASAKIRAGMPKDDKSDLNDEDMTAKTWTGIIPVTQAYDGPLPAPHNKVEPPPDYIATMIGKTR